MDGAALVVVGIIAFIVAVALLIALRIASRVDSKFEENARWIEVHNRKLDRTASLVEDIRLSVNGFMTKFTEKSDEAAHYRGVAEEQGKQAARAAEAAIAVARVVAKKAEIDQALAEDRPATVHPGVVESSRIADATEGLRDETKRVADAAEAVIPVPVVTKEGV